MKIFLLVSSLAMAALAHPDYSESWQEFKDKYDKEYETEEEETYRAEVWSTNVHRIMAHNAEAEDGQHSFHLGENEFADMTSDEITAYFNGLSGGENVRSRVEFQSDVTGLPESVDWREKKIVTPVKNQAACGSCWAFSTTGSLEGQWALKTGQLVSLSEQNLVDCSQEEGNHGCHGGLMDYGFKYVKDNDGLDTENSYPYTAKDGPRCLYNNTNAGATLTSWVDVARESEADLQKAVATVGPISVGIDASRPTFHFYKKGVYHDPHCSSTMLDHGVLAVGYGTDKSGDKAEDFWIVKNSWGESWGAKGYINMARNKDNACGIASAASYPVV